MKIRIKKILLSILLCISLTADITASVYAGDGDTVSEGSASEDAVSEGSAFEDTVSEDTVSEDTVSENVPEISEKRKEEPAPGVDTFVSGYFELPGKEAVSCVEEGIGYGRIEAELIERVAEDGEADIVLSYAPGRETQIGRAFPFSYTEKEQLEEYFGTRYPVNRDQNPYGSCWAHSAMALIEFYMINHGMLGAGTDIDLSELHTIYYTYNQGSPSLAGDTGDMVFFKGSGGILNAGGNLDFASQTLMCARGAVSENEMPYSLAASVNSGTYTPQDNEFSSFVRLKNAKEINIKNTEIIKQCIMENGAVGASVYSSDSYYSYQYNSYYCATQTKTNHAICLVGWDDDFPAENFKASSGKYPDNNGAWLVRNSWNADGSALLSYNDYFWISYEDSGLSKPNGSSEKSVWTFDVADPLEIPQNNYFYTSQIHSKSYIKTAYCANQYTACSGAPAEEIKAVSFDVLGLSKDGTEYEVSIYTGVDPQKGPASGVLDEASITRGVLYLDGKYTIDLRKSVNVAAGETFAVVLKRSDNYTACYERAYSRDNGIEYTVSCDKCQSFYSSDGVAWTDVVGSSSNNNRSNFALNVLTDDTDVIIPSTPFSPLPNMEKDTVYLVKGQSFVPLEDEGFNSTDSNIVKIGKGGKITAVKVGKCELRSASGRNINVFVTKPEIKEKNVKLIAGDELDLNDSIALNVDNTDLSDEYPAFFYSSDPSVVSVRGKKAVARSAGSAVIRCVINSKTCMFKVKVSEHKEQKLSKNGDTLVLSPMQSVQLKLSGYSFKNVKWSSDLGMTELAYRNGCADGVVFIGKTGRLTAIGSGTTQIECSNGIRFTVTVREPSERVYYLNASGSRRLKINGIKNSEVYWILKKGKDVISLDEKGVVKAFAAGEAEVECYCNPYPVEGSGFRFAIKVYAEKPAFMIKDRLFSAGKNNYILEMKKGEKLRLLYPAEEGHALYQQPVYKSSKPFKAFADEYGFVYAVDTGESVVSTKINGKTYKIRIKVVPGK